MQFLESLIAFKRAGANAIVSYYADRIDKILINYLKEFINNNLLIG